MAETSPELTLSKGSAFALVTTLLLALLFHPFQGSLIHGPTLYLWLGAPTAVLTEIRIILGVIFKHCIRHGPKDLRHELFCLVIARLANSHGADRRLLLRRDATEAERQFKKWVKKVYKGWRYRLAITIPIIAQYIKLMATSGTGTIALKTIGTLYITHWAMLEILLLTAKQEEDRETINRVEQLVPMHKSLDGLGEDVTTAAMETGEAFLHREPAIYKVHQVAFVMCSLPMIIMSWPIHVILIGVIVPWIWLLKTWLQLNWRAERLTVSPVRTIQWKDAMVLLPFGGPSVGSDIGGIFNLFWILYCVSVYNGEGTSRPQWPWLDWFG